MDGDRMLVLSLAKEIAIVGEAASKVSQETQAAYPEIPWPELIGIRNRLIHAYFDINLDIVWQTVVEDLPVLLAKLEEVFPDRPA